MPGSRRKVRAFSHAASAVGRLRPSEAAVFSAFAASAQSIERAERTSGAYQLPRLGDSRHQEAFGQIGRVLSRDPNAVGAGDLTAVDTEKLAQLNPLGRPGGSRPNDHRPPGSVLKLYPRNGHSLRQAI